MNYDDYKYGYKHKEQWNQTQIDSASLEDKIKKLTEMMVGVDKRKDKILEVAGKRLDEVEEFLKEKFPEDFI